MPSDQLILTEALRAVFPSEVPVKSEWAALSGEKALYSPRVDIAVGPFATDTRHEGTYDRLGRDYRDLLSELHAHFSRNVLCIDSQDEFPSLSQMCYRNRNARCFLAIEIERSGSRKHVLGGAINAAALGRLGLSVACSPERLRAVLKMRRCLLFLASLGKNTFDPTNLLVVTAEQFADSLGVEINDFQHAVRG